MSKNRRETNTQACLGTQRRTYETTHTRTHRSSHAQTQAQIYTPIHIHPCAHAHRAPYQHSPVHTPPWAGRGAFPGDLTEWAVKLYQLCFKADLAPVSLVICSRISAHGGAGPGLRSGPLTFSQEVPLSPPLHPHHSPALWLWLIPLTSITC